MTTTNEVRIETSTLCNYKCKFCPHHTKSFTRKKEIMSFDFFKEIIDKVKKQAPEISYLTISGFGESTLDKGIIDKIKYATSLGYHVFLLTNGSNLTIDYVNELFFLNVDIRISLHTIIPEEYEAITGNKNLKSVIDIIDYMIAHPNKTNITITADVIEDNEKNIDKLIKKYKDDVLLEVWKPHNWANWGTYRDYSLNRKKTCGRPKNGPLQIQVDGTVNMCCFDFNGELLLGDLKTQSLEEIFQGDMFNKILEHHEKGTIDQSTLLCSKCDQLASHTGTVLFNSKFLEEDRVEKVSSTHRKVIE
jgi:MoaA/NifB/PqqE/SkfB family radical SAM enzyme